MQLQSTAGSLSYSVAASLCQDMHKQTCHNGSMGLSF